MKTSISRRAGCLGLSVATAIFAAAMPEARAQRAPDDYDAPQRRARVSVCAEIAYRPLSRCGRRVDVSLAWGDWFSVEDVLAHMPPDLHLSFDRETGAGTRILPLGMRYGLAPQPTEQFELTREMLFWLARITGEGRILRVATTLAPTSSMRAFEEVEMLGRARARATFIEIEEFKGIDPLTPALAAQASYAIAGAVLFGGGIGAEHLLHGSLGDAFDIHPQLWPPGLLIKGSFRVP